MDSRWWWFFCAKFVFGRHPRAAADTKSVTVGGGLASVMTSPHRFSSAKGQFKRIEGL